MNKKFKNEAAAFESRRLLAPDPNRLVTTKDLAEMISWHEESVRRACRQGRIAAVKCGSGWRVPPRVVTEILEHGIPMEAA